ncbi:MAG: DUF4097 family beta strand repeat protein [bacterium]|nr:DUF4097 family beta strand repeat protein [bacterium]
MRSRLHKLTTLFAAALFLTLAGGAAALQMSEDYTYSYALTADGRLSLENVNGDVKIEAWDRDEVSIEAIKRGRSQEALDAARIDIDASDDRIRIETRYARDGRRDSASVDYTIYVPRGAELDEIELVNGSLDLSGVAGDVAASLVNGEVTARDLAGNVEISSVNGEMVVALAEFDADHSIDLSSVNGSLELKMPGRADADIEATTVHGGIRNDFGLEVDRSGFVGRKLRGQMGAGGARISLSNVNGSIDISQAD